MERILAHKKLVVIFIVLLAGAIGSYQFYQKSREDEFKIYGNVDVKQVSLAFNSVERIEEMLVEEGARVKKGDVLARLNTKSMELMVARMKSQIAGQEAVLAKLRHGALVQEVQMADARVRAEMAEYDDALLDHKRKATLYQAGAVSKQELDLAVARLKRAEGVLAAEKKANELTVIGPRQEDIAAAEASLKALQAELGFYEYNLSQMTLVAPQNGIIRSRILQVGDMASPVSPVYLLSLNDDKWIRAYIVEKRLGEIKEGMKARVYTDTCPDKPIEGTVGYISHTAEFTPKAVQTEELRTSLVYEVRINVEDKDDVLRLGMPVTVKF